MAQLTYIGGSYTKITTSVESMHMLTDHDGNMVMIYDVDDGTEQRIVFLKIDMPTEVIIGDYSFVAGAQVVNIILAPSSQGNEVYYYVRHEGNHLLFWRVSLSNPIGQIYIKSFPNRNVFNSVFVQMGSGFFSFTSSDSFGPSSNSIAVFNHNIDFIPVGESWYQPDNATTTALHVNQYSVSLTSYTPVTDYTSVVYSYSVNPDTSVVSVIEAHSVNHYFLSQDYTSTDTNGDTWTYQRAHITSSVDASYTLDAYDSPVVIELQMTQINGIPYELQLTDDTGTLYTPDGNWLVMDNTNFSVNETVTVTINPTATRTMVNTTDLYKLNFKVSGMYYR